MRLAHKQKRLTTSIPSSEDLLPRTGQHSPCRRPPAAVAAPKVRRLDEPNRDGGLGQPVTHRGPASRWFSRPARPAASRMGRPDRRPGRGRQPGRLADDCDGPCARPAGTGKRVSRPGRGRVPVLARFRHPVLAGTEQAAGAKQRPTTSVPAVERGRLGPRQPIRVASAITNTQNPHSLRIGPTRLLLFVGFSSGRCRLLHDRLRRSCRGSVPGGNRVGQRSETPRGRTPRHAQPFGRVTSAGRQRIPGVLTRGIRNPRLYVS